MTVPVPCRLAGEREKEGCACSSNRGKQVAGYLRAFGPYVTEGASDATLTAAGTSESSPSMFMALLLLLLEEWRRILALKFCIVDVA